VEQQEIDGFQQRWIVERAVGRTLHIGCGMKPIPGAVNADPSPERWGWSDVACDAHTLPFADGVFDSVVSNHVIPHLHDPVSALREMARVLRHGGTMAHVIPDLRYAPRRREYRHPFGHQPHGWHGPEEFMPVMAQVADVLTVLRLEAFRGFKWSFGLEAVRLSTTPPQAVGFPPQGGFHELDDVLCDAELEHDGIAQSDGHLG